jgi:hypothetical protein
MPELLLVPRRWSWLFAGELKTDNPGFFRILY